jgi:hypothetical protein
VILNEPRATPRSTFSDEPIDQPWMQGLFLRPAALSFARVARLNHAHSALLDTKKAPAGRIGFVLTGPKHRILPSIIVKISLRERFIYAEIGSMFKNLNKLT